MKDQEEKHKEEKEHEKEIRRKREELKDENKPDRYVKAFSMFLNLLTISVKRIHIWYEDDFFSGQNPFSFGLVLNEFKVYNFDKDITFQTPTSVNYSEINPEDINNLYIKKIKLNDCKLYWNSKSETYIPSSLIIDTKSNSKQ